MLFRCDYNANINGLPFISKYKHGKIIDKPLFRININNIFMVSTINERISIIISELGYRSVRQFANKIGIAQTSLNDVVKKNAEPKFSTIDKILKAEPSISSDWLLTGKGEMLKKEHLSTNNNSGTIYGSQGGTNNGNYNNIGNNYNFTLPEKGHVKIIRPDGTVSTESYNSDIENRLAELEALREKIVVLDKLVKSQEEQIELYKMKIDMLEHRQ